MTAAISLGVAGSLGPAAVARIARAAEAAGFAAVWVNDTPEGDALAALDAAARATSRLQLATGVLPVDRRSAAEVADRVADLPQDRLTLGVGSGAARTGQLDLVAGALDALREATRARLVVGALGPRMRRLAAERADGALLSWLSPDLAGLQAGEAHDIRPTAHVALYVRTAVDDDAVPRLREETARYAGYPNYAANFARMGLDPDETVLTPATTAGRLPAYRAGVDEVVLRAITPTDDPDAYVRLVERAAPLLAR